MVPVHKNPAQVLRLLARLHSEETTLLVHVDARAPAAVHLEIAEGSRKLGVELLDSIPCYWGGAGLVHVGLMAIERLLGRADPFEHLVYVTGQDYPLVPPQTIRRFFEQARGSSFLSFFPLPGIWPGGGLDRFERWHLVWRVVLHLRLPWRRQIPHGLRPYGGGAHWALARAAAEYVHDYTRRNRDVVSFFDHVLHPEELIFQTILLNSDLAGTVVNDNVRYIDWSVEPGPKVLGHEDLDAALASRKLFGRKFDDVTKPGVLDALDDALDRMMLAGATDR